MIPIKYLILEGPDCCGKSTLFQNLHKLTGHAHHIVDRSRLSRLCYARLYGRSTEVEERDALLEEVCNANIYTVILLPAIDTILERLKTRGDEFQDEESIVRLYRIYEEESNLLSLLPNVLIVREEMQESQLTQYVHKCIQSYRQLDAASLLVAAPFWSSMTSHDEVQFVGTFEVPVSHSDPQIMDDEKEGEYYLGILRGVQDRIRAEINGSNEYGIPQDPSKSRRFYYSSDSCISSIHLILRSRTLKVMCVLRSTDAVRNASIDSRFLAHLSSEIPKGLGWSLDKIELTLRMNSLHVRNDRV